MSKIYFISDLHFGHENIMKYSPKYRNFNSVAEMDEYLIALWNDTVSDDDIVYNLGDLSFHKDSTKTARILERLNGSHRLILGNHDKQIIANTDLQGYFDEICDYKYFKAPGVKKGFVLFHYPILEWNGAHYGSVHLYGHVHDKTPPLKGRAINVCYDYNGRFLEFKEILKMAEKLDFSGFIHNSSDDESEE
ncbi:metallophosphoesterase [Campylobacter sp. VBCF_08 NA3]|uniref:metallophosphoesterase n=1 Tax=Campylobacter sp. VBCF_08 NA3 TaxID=2983833 RepID=UPI0022E9CAE2|nr:metallophosphoesterase [Campylobacter sp. VBCF_08 NA3]MDA3069514.1 metallophosphoesterase [Campylobacter sp. VBCF_08 NA3]